MTGSPGCMQGEGIMFLFTDSQIVDEKMLVYVNDLLSSGEIPDLFAQEDKDEIVNAVRSETKTLGLVDTAENCWATFIQKVNHAWHHGSQLLLLFKWHEPSPLEYASPHFSLCETCSQVCVFAMLTRMRALFTSMPPRCR